MRLQTKLCALLFVLVLPGLAGCGAAQKSATTSKPATPVLSSGGGNGSLYIQVPEPLDDPSVPGVSLDKALSLIGKPLPLPPAKPSEIAKILFDQPPGLPGFSLAIRYTSGVKLFVVSGTDNLASVLANIQEGIATSPYSDGQQHDKLTTVAGKEVLTTVGGIQMGKAAGWRVPTSVEWNQDGNSYTLYSPVTDVSTQATDAALSDLLTLVTETK